MIQSQEFSFAKLMLSFRFAGAGLKKFIMHERNARIHGIATILVIIASFIWKVNAGEAIALSLAVALVWITEMLNSVIEKTVDQIRHDHHAEIAFIKDIAAGAVLVASIVSLFIACLIFLPKIL